MAIRNSACKIYFIFFCLTSIRPSHIPWGAGHLYVFFFSYQFLPRKTMHLFKMSFLTCFWWTEWDCHLQLWTSVLFVSNEILPHPGPVLLWPWLVPSAVRIREFIAKGMKILAPGHVLDDFSPLGSTSFCTQQLLELWKSQRESHPRGSSLHCSALPSFLSLASRWARTCHGLAAYRLMFHSATSVYLSWLKCPSYQPWKCLH